MLKINDRVMGHGLTGTVLNVLDDKILVRTCGRTEYWYNWTKI